MGLPAGHVTDVPGLSRSMTDHKEVDVIARVVVVIVMTFIIAFLLIVGYAVLLRLMGWANG